MTPRPAVRLCLDHPFGRGPTVWIVTDAGLLHEDVEVVDGDGSSRVGRVESIELRRVMRPRRRLFFWTRMVSVVERRVRVRFQFAAAG